MATLIARKRNFETPDTAPYKRQVLVSQLNADLGQPANPKVLAPPTEAQPDAQSFVSTTIPTTSGTIKKTNVQIPYTRVVRDPTHLGEVAHPVFVRAEYDGNKRAAPVPELRMDTMAGIDAVNAELAAKWQDEQMWRVDGVLLSTQNEMDPELQAKVGNDEALTDSTAALIALQGPTQMRNIFCSRPLVGDLVYLGLLRSPGGSTGYRWVPFCSQHLDMGYVPERPRAFQLGFSGIVNRKIEHVEFTDKQRRRLCRAVCLGRIMDTCPSPGMIVVNVQLREMSIDELGRRHDEANTTVGTDPTTGVETWTYHGTIGSFCSMGISGTPMIVSPPPASSSPPGWQPKDPTPTSLADPELDAHDRLSRAVNTAFALQPLQQLDDPGAAQDAYLQGFLVQYPSIPDAGAGWSKAMLDPEGWKELFASFGVAAAASNATKPPQLAQLGITNETVQADARANAMMRVAHWLVVEAGVVLKRYADNMQLPAGPETQQALQQLLLMLESMFAAIQSRETVPNVRARALGIVNATKSVVLGTEPLDLAVLKMAVVAAEAAEAILLATES